MCEGSSQNVIIRHDLTTAQQKHSRLTLNKLLIAFTASINTEPVSIQCLIKNLPNKQCPLETETKESNNEWRRSRSWRMMTFWLLSSHIQQQQSNSKLCIGSAKETPNVFYIGNTQNSEWLPAPIGWKIDASEYRHVIIF